LPFGAEIGYKYVSSAETSRFRRTFDTFLTAGNRSMGWLRRASPYATTLIVVVYCASVLYHVYSAYYVGLRGLFSTSPGTAAGILGTSVGWSDDAHAYDGNPPHNGDLVMRVAGRDVPSAIHLQDVARLAVSGELGPVQTVGSTADLGKLPPEVVLADAEGSRWARVDYIPNDSDTPRQTWLRLLRVSAVAVWLSSAWFLMEMVIFGIGMFVALRRPGDASARLFFMLCTVNVVTFMGAFHWPNLIGSIWLVFPFVFCAMLISPMTLHFFALFPRPLGVIRARPRLSVALLYAGPVSGMIYLFYQIVRIDRLYWIPTSSNEISEMLGRLAGTIYGYLALSVAMYLVGFGVLLYRYSRGRTPQERQQVWSLLAAVMLTMGPVGYLLVTALRDRAEFAFGPLPKLMVYVTSLVFTTAYGLSITRYKLLQMGRFVNRGILYVGISSLATLLFCALVGLTTALIGTFYFEWENALMTGLTAMVLVVVLGWIRDRFQRSLDRSFYREKYRLDKAVRQLGAAVDRLVEPAQLARQLLQGARETIGAAGGVVYLREPDGDDYFVADQSGWPHAPSRLAAGDPLLQELAIAGVLRSSATGAGGRALQSFGAALGYLLELEGAIIGAAFFSARSDGDVYSPEDQTFVAALVRTTTLALSTAQGHQMILTLKEQLQQKVDKIADQQRRIMFLQGELLSRGEGEPRTDEPRQAEAAETDTWHSEILGSSPAVRELLDKAAKVAQSPASVLVRGESGTGKELLARAIHRNGPRAARPFVSVHCAALSSSLLESELFGHVKGAFTGADRDKAGRFEMADGGTLFLDEIGDISLETQTKLLRVLQERSFERVGGVQTIAVDVRLIAATHQNLEELIRQGRFREDLFYRLNVISLRCPPLRDRREDIFELSLYFLRTFAARTGKAPSRIDEDALEVLTSYDWPGNIRQLENALERAVVLAESDEILVEDLPPEIVSAVLRGGDKPKPATLVRREPPAGLRRDLPAAPSEPAPPAPPAGAAPSSPAPLPLGVRLDPLPAASRVAEGRRRRVETVVSPPVGLADELDDLERERLSEALVRSGGNKAEAARALGIPRSTLFSKLRKYGLD
jgi:DNA-binding NtrC family response regulator